MKPSGMGGQPVLEGTMARNRSRYAVAVRKPDGEVVVKKEKFRSARDRSVVLRFPIIRGIAAFIEFFILGLKTLSYSADFMEEEEEKMAQEDEDGPASGWEKFRNILIVLISVIFALMLFMLVPYGLSVLLRGKIQSDTVLAAIEVALRIVIFLGYVVAISFTSDIRRIFMYHGAEHKAVNCIEKGFDLTVGNVKKQSCFYKRCETSFILIVVFLSVVLFFFIHINNIWLRMLYRVLLIPIVAGVSFEFFMVMAGSDHPFSKILSLPARCLQKLIAREPDEGMIEVAIASIEAVFDWRKYQSRMREQASKKSEKSERTPMAALSLDEEKDARKAALAAKEKEEAKKKEQESKKAEAAKKKEQETTKEEEPGIKKDQTTKKKEEKTDKKAAKEPDSKKKPEEKKESKTQEAEGGKKRDKTSSEKNNKRNQREKKKSGNLLAGFARKGHKSRSQLRKELEEREESYHNRAAERARQMKEQEEREAADEKAYQEAKKRKAERLAATQKLPKLSNNLKPAPKLEMDENDELKNLDRYFGDDSK